MVNKIEAYVRRKRTIVRQYTTPPISDGVINHYCLSKQVTEYENSLPEADLHMLEVLGEFCKGKNIKVEIYDVSTLKGRLKASLRGITETPAAIIGQHRIEGELTSELLRSKFEHALET